MLDPTFTGSNCPCHNEYRESPRNEQICAYCLGGLAPTTTMSRTCDCPQEPATRILSTQASVDIASIVPLIERAAFDPTSLVDDFDAYEDLSLARAILLDLKAVHACRQHGDHDAT